MKDFEDQYKPREEEHGQSRTVPWSRASGSELNTTRRTPRNKLQSQGDLMRELLDVSGPLKHIQAPSGHHKLLIKYRYFIRQGTDQP